MSFVELVSELRTGIAQIVLQRAGDVVGTGTGFLTDDGIVTNTHVIKPGIPHDTTSIWFEKEDRQSLVESFSIPAHKLNSFIGWESSEDAKDVALLEVDIKALAERHRFKFADSARVLSVGEQVAFLGFPFGMPHLTAHLGYVSSLYTEGVDKIQIDGSVNGGNSGGPLVDPTSGEVIGIVTRAHTGLIEKEFNELLASFKANIELLKAVRGPGQGVSLGPVSLLGSQITVQEQMLRIAKNLKRSANIGIGVAYSARYAREFADKRKKA